MQGKRAGRAAETNGFDVYGGITEDGPQPGGQRGLRLCSDDAGSHLYKHLGAVSLIGPNVENQVARTYELRIELAQCLSSVPQVGTQIPIPQLTSCPVDAQIAHDIEKGFHYHA